MSERLSRSAPYQITDINIHSINDVFRQLQAAIDEAKGLLGTITLYAPVTFNSSQFGSLTNLQDVAATEDLGTSAKLVRADHRHAHGTGYLPDAHHAKSHQALHNNAGVDALKLDDLATPDDNTDLNASAALHGLLRKLSGSATDFLDGSGAWSTPSGSAEQKTPAFVDGDESQQDWETVLHGLQEFLYSFKDSVIHLLGFNRFRYLNSMASVYQSVDQNTITVNTWQVLNFGAELFDTDGIHDNVTNNSRLTLPLIGKWIVWGALYNEYSGITTPAQQGLRIHVNGLAGGANDIWGYNLASAAGATTAGIATSAIITVTAITDYVELAAIVTGAGGTWDADKDAYQGLTNFGCAYIGE